MWSSHAYVVSMTSSHNLDNILGSIVASVGRYFDSAGGVITIVIPLRGERCQWLDGIFSCYFSIATYISIHLWIKTFGCYSVYTILFFFTHSLAVQLWQ